jgi:transcriptional regulator with XRE-family HTH domain
VPPTPHPFLKRMGIKIKRLRERKGLSQEALADLAQLDRSYMSGIERGVRNVSVLNLAKIARALSVPPASLLDAE